MIEIPNRRRGEKIHDFRTEFFKNNEPNILTDLNPYRLYDKNNDVFNKGLPVVFVTTPSLNLSNQNISYDGFFRYVKNGRPELFKSLSYLTAEGTDRPFINIISNQFKSISIPSTQTTAREVNETFYGYRQNLPSTIVNSIAGGELNMTFKENKYLDIVSLHKLWLDYTEHVSRGIMLPSRHMVRRRFLDYTSSIYYFLLDFDMESILFYSKYTGCVPSNVPYDVMSAEVGSPEVTDVSIDYLFSYKEDLNPDILYDFNTVTFKGADMVAKQSKQKLVDMLIEDRGKYNGGDFFEDENLSNINKPYVSLDSETGRYRLKFLKRGQDKDVNEI